jgi:putative lipoprotein
MLVRRPTYRRTRLLCSAAALLGALCCLPRAARAEPPAADPDPWLGPDKALHFGASAAIAGGGYAFGAVLFEDYAPRVGLATGLALSAGVTKEALDAAGLGRPSWRDLAWDVFGTAVGVGIALAIDVAIREPR